MNADVELLALFGDGKVHSGAVIAQAFGISRAAVWKRVQRLRVQGIEVEAVAGSGYRMRQPWHALDSARVLERLDGHSRGLLGQLDIVATTGSTNDDLRAAAASLPDLSVLAAEHQARGRGRRGRTWHSPAGAGLWFSVLMHNEVGVAELAGLSLAVAVLLADGLESVGARGVKLKWPNDLLFDGRKLGGILIEISGDWHGPSTAVIGVGINMALPNAISQPAASVSQALESGSSQDRNDVFAALLNALLPGLASFRSNGFADFRARWQARDALDGLDVVLDGARVHQGVACGIDVNGMLLVRTPEGVQAVVAGEVSVRPTSREMRVSANSR